MVVILGEATGSQALGEKSVLMRTLALRILFFES
jgi:hypothetical protein